MIGSKIIALEEVDLTRALEEAEEITVLEEETEVVEEVAVLVVEVEGVIELIKIIF